MTACWADSAASRGTACAPTAVMIVADFVRIEHKIRHDHGMSSREMYQRRLAALLVDKCLFVEVSL